MDIFPKDADSRREAVRSAQVMAQACARLIVKTPGMSRSDVVEALEASMSSQGGSLERHDNTVTRWLYKASELGLIERRGDFAAARYYPTPALTQAWVRSELARPLSQRRRVGYDEKLLNQYVPNQTFYLSAAQRESLEQTCPVGSATLATLGSHQVSTFLCDIAHWSSHLEGNSYEYADTVRLLNEGITRARANPAEAITIRNHHDAIRYVIDNVAPAQTPSHERGQFLGLVPIHIQAIHAKLADGIEDESDCGRLRSTRIKVHESAYIPLEIPAVIQKTFSDILRKAARIKNPWECALFLNVHLPYLQPFIDLNKRTARVACNIPLFQAGVTPMTWTEVPRHDYLEAMTAIYEFREPALLASLFFDGYLRSNERLTVMLRQRSPSALQVQFRDEIKMAVRARVLHGVDSLPPHLPQDQIEAFMEHVQRQLAAMENNPISAMRFDLTVSQVQAYLRTSRQAAGHKDGLELATTMRERVR